VPSVIYVERCATNLVGDSLVTNKNLPLEKKERKNERNEKENKDRLNLLEKKIQKIPKPKKKITSTSFERFFTGSASLLKSNANSFTISLKARYFVYIVR